MVQKKLSQKKSQKRQEKCEQAKETKNELKKREEKDKKDENNNKIELKSDFCDQDHFVCSKFTNDQFEFIRCALIKLKEDKESSHELDLIYLDELLSDHHLQTRYMMRLRYDQDKQIEFIISVLKWRKENRISFIRKELFPREPYELGPVFPYKRTKKNQIVCYLRFCLYPHNSVEFMDEFSIYQLYVITRLAIQNNTTWIWFFGEFVFSKCSSN